MISALMKREHALRWLPAGCAFAAALAVIVGDAMMQALAMHPPAEVLEDGEVLGRGGGAATPGFGTAYAVALMCGVQSTAVALARFLPIRIRVREFERALPITTRDAVVARALTTWIVLLAPILAATAVLAAHPVEDRWRVPLHGALAVACATSLMFAYRPTCATLGVLETVGVIIAGLAVLVASAAAPAGPFTLGAALVTGASIAIIAVRTGRRSAADDPGPERSGAPATPADLGVRVFGPLRWTLLRSTALRPQALVFFALAAIAPAGFAGGNRALLVWIAVLVATTALRLGLQSLHGLGGLPVPRERLLRYATLPSLLVLVASVTASALIPRPYTNLEPFSRSVAIDRASDDTLTDTGAYQPHVRVPPSLWRIGSRADAAVTTPWGERVEIHAHPLWPGSDLVAYNPYDLDAMECDARVLEWQLARALTALHGNTPDPEAAATRWVAGGFHEKDEGEWAWRRELPIKAALPRLRESDATEHGYPLQPWRDAPRRAGFAALQAVLLWLVVSAFVLRPNVPDVRGRLWRRVLRSDGLGIGVVAFLAIAVVMYEAGDRALIQVLEASAGQWIDARIGGSPWAWTALVGAAAAGGSALLRWRIRRIEVPRLALNGWTKKPVAIF